MFVTGGSKGIGKAIVEAFARDPAHHVVFTYRHGREESQEMERRMERVRGVHMDLLDVESIAAATKQAFSLFDGYDVLVHNAGYCDDSPFFFMEEGQWSNVIQTALNSFFYLNKSFLPHMISNRHGRIIVMASVSGENGTRGQANYSAAKGALIAASKSLAKEVGRKGVLVNVVSPGLIETDMTKAVATDHFMDRFRDLIPVGRMGRPEEVAAAVTFLASDAASYVNGTVLQVNGGLYS